MESNSDIDTEWKDWKAAGSDQSKLRGFVNKLEPVITSTLRSAGISSPVVQDRAKLLAAKAIQSYDPNKGGKLATHVSSQLRSIVRDAPSIQEPFAPGNRYRGEATTMYRAQTRFNDTFGRDPSDEEMADLTQIPLRKVIRIRSSARARIPLSVMEESDDDGSSSDVIGTTRTPHDDWADAVYAGLGDVDKLIFMHKTGYRNAQILDPTTLAQKVGLSADAVRARANRMQAQLDSFRIR